MKFVDSLLLGANITTILLNLIFICNGFDRRFECLSVSVEITNSIVLKNQIYGSEKSRKSNLE